MAIDRETRGPEPTHRVRIPTHHGRQGRLTDRMRRALTEIAPRFGLDRRPIADRLLILEVGCGHGEAAMAFAFAHPELDVLAVDVFGPGVAQLVQARAAGGPANLYLERVDALDLLEQRLGAGTLAAVHLFFPDPWPKARHHKRRFVRPDVLDLLADRMALGATLLIATDTADYATWSIEHLDAHPCFDGGVTDRPCWRPATRYEQAARDAGRDVVELAYRRR